MNDNQSQELRFKRGDHILEYLRKFSATEKAVFGMLVLIAMITAFIMALQVNNYFIVEVPASGGSLHEGLVGLPHTVNPVLAVTDIDRDLSVLVYAGLTRDVNGTIQPDLALNWTVSSDGLTYMFNLKPNLKFQNGTPLTADDIAFTIAKVQDPALKSPRAGDWANVTATVLSPTQIQFVLKQPYGSFLESTSLGILPKQIWSSVSDDQFIFSQYNIQPIGAGPYKITGIDRDKSNIPTAYHLSTWSGYNGMEPYISNLDFSLFPDDDHALAALESGSIDSLPSITPDAAATLASNGGGPYRIMQAPLSRIFGVFFNQGANPVLADSAVRQALAMSVDRTAIINTVLNGYGEAVTGPLPNDLGNATSSTPNLAGARVILAKDGWIQNTDGIYEKKTGKNATTTLSFTLYTADVSDLQTTANLLKSEWAALGADVTVKVYDESDLYNSVIQPRSYDALLFGEEVGAAGDIYAFWDSAERVAPGLNVALYANSKVDTLLNTIRATPIGPARAPLYNQLSSLITTDMPAIFLYQPDFIYAVPKTLKGIELGPMNVPGDRFDSIDSWYNQTERVWKIFAP